MRVRAAARLAGFLLLAVLASAAATAENLRLEGDFRQGGLIRGQAPPGVEVRFLGRLLRQTADGGFVFGLHRDFPETGELALRWPDGRRSIERLTIAPREYAVQRIDGLPRKMVSPGKKALERIRRDVAAVKRARAADSALPDWRDGFDWPLRGIVTGVYGSQRILNGEPRRPHYGIDIAAPAGTPVTAPAAGRVTLAEDLYFTGGTLILDHGHGLNSTYSHLESLAVAVGETVARGQVIGRVGSTGRSTGAHLDWRINWFDQRLDPAAIAGPMPGG